MRHGKSFNHLSRTASHRKSLLANQAKSLILHKRIITTVAKAKALRRFIEPIITKSKHDTTHARRTVFSYFQDKEPVKVLFDDVANKVADRPGGYTRIIRIDNRLGDNAEMCMIELVDYNDLLQKERKYKKSRTRRGKGKGKIESNIEVSIASRAALAPEEAKEFTEITEAVEVEPIVENNNESSDNEATESLSSSPKESTTELEKSKEQEGQLALLASSTDVTNKEIKDMLATISESDKGSTQASEESQEDQQPPHIQQEEK